MVNDLWLKNKHTISKFQAQVRDLAKHIEAQPKKHNAYKEKTCIQIVVPKRYSSTLGLLTECWNIKLSYKSLFKFLIILT